jgi:hypothetical protein
LPRDPRIHSVTTRAGQTRALIARRPHITGNRMEREKKAMYDMYPEWGPAAHDEEHPANPAHWATPVQESMDLRDNGGERPDDN